MPLLPKDQRGVTPVVIIAVVVVILLAAGGFFLMSKNGNTPSIPSTPSIVGMTLNPNCAYKDPDLCKFMNNWKESKQMAVKSVTTPKSGPKVEASFESIGQDKNHITMSENGKEGWNVITINDTTYTKDYSDNKWWKQKKEKVDDLKDKTNFDFKFDESDKKQEEDKTEYKKIGKEACGSMQCFKYQIIDPANKDITQFIFFDDREYLLRKMVDESKDGMTVMEFSYSGISINEPTPTKDAKPDQMILPTGGSFGLSEEDKKQLEDAQKQSGDIIKQYQNPVPEAPSGDSDSEAPSE